MGGDHGPEVTIAGALAAIRELPGVEVLLVGDEPAVRARLGALGEGGNPRLEVVHASETVGMDESPAAAVRAKRDNSMSVGMRLVKAGMADAFVTAGSTGAALAASLFELGRIPGVRRPALATLLPGTDCRYLLLDIGANADCRPQDLVQFGLMGHVYAGRVLGVQAPRIGLLSNGEEEGKGSQLVKEAFPLLSQSRLRFIGNVESKDLIHGVADIAVTDGFTGNILIKTAEGTAGLITQGIRDAANSDLRSKLGGLLLKPALRRAFAGLDYAEVGGAPLLGVAGVVVVGHGRSNVRAITSLIRAGADAARGDVVAAIGNGLREFDLLKDQMA